ncbi:RacP protein [Streptomyces sp. NPDC018045]|uniref:RacP protein n=1 Tax=Streptomyces sp. NPDC018045 TaxID=3365037 RepID=UPI0037AA6281
MPRGQSRKAAAKKKPRPAQKGDAARRHADRIRKALLEARPAGLHTPQLMRACALTRSQVAAGIAMLRDQAAEKHWPPLVWTREGSYCFCGDPHELRRYEIRVTSEYLTEMRRLHSGTVAPHVELHPTDRFGNYLITQVSALETTLDLIVHYAPQ